MLIYWSVPDRLVTPGTESLTRHIDLLDAVTHTHLRFANLAKHKQVSTFSFSHLQNFHLFFTDASISDTSAFSPFASTTRKDEIYDSMSLVWQLQSTIVSNTNNFGKKYLKSFLANHYIIKSFIIPW